MSSIASHSLVACKHSCDENMYLILVIAAADEPRIRLCDLTSGAFTHSLTGHRGYVLSCVWSTNQEYILYSGG